MKAITQLEHICLILRRQGAESRWKSRGKYTEERQRTQRAGGNSSEGIVCHLQLEHLTFKLGSGNPKGKAQYILRFVQGSLNENISMIQH